jgi:hypothetical protein
MNRYSFETDIYTSSRTPAIRLSGWCDEASYRVDAASTGGHALTHSVARLPLSSTHSLFSSTANTNEPVQLGLTDVILGVASVVVYVSQRVIIHHSTASSTTSKIVPLFGSSVDRWSYDQALTSSLRER